MSPFVKALIVMVITGIISLGLAILIGGFL
jgi:hypothetical protein